MRYTHTLITFQAWLVNNGIETCSFDTVWVNDDLDTVSLRNNSARRRNAFAHEGVTVQTTTTRVQTSLRRQQPTTVIKRTANVLDVDTLTA